MAFRRLLFVAGFTLSAIHVERPSGTQLVLFSHFGLWLLGSFMSVVFIGPFF